MAHSARTRDSLLGILILAILGYGALRWVEAARPTPPVAPPRVLAPIPVALSELELTSVAPRVEGFGSLRAARRARIAAESSARIVAVHPQWRSGARVEAGAVLLALDSEKLELERARLAAALEGGRALLQGAREEARQAELGLALSGERLAGLAREERRWSDLFATGHANESQLDAGRRARTEAAIAEEQAGARIARANSEVRRAAASVDELERQVALLDLALERSRVLAPFAGHLDGRAPGLGTLVQAGEPLGELLDIATLHLVLKIPEDRVAELAPGLEVEIDVPAQPGVLRRGRVASIGVLADPGTRAFDVEIDVPNDPETLGDPELGEGAARRVLRDGQFAHAVIRLERLDDVLVLDQGHFTFRDGRPVAFVWRDPGAGEEQGRAELRELELGPRVGEAQVVFAGVLAGERLITAPLAYLTDGAPVVSGVPGVPGAPAAPAAGATGGER